MILHFFAEHKFISFVVNQFVSVSFDNSRYFVVNKSGCQEYIFFKDQFIEKKMYAQFSDLNIDWSEVKSGVVHYLNEDSAKIVNSSPNHVRWLWSIFGGDIYPYIFSDKTLLNNNIELEVFIYNLFEKNIFKRWIYRHFYSRKKYLESFQYSNQFSNAIIRFAYYSTVIPPEAKYFKENNHLLQAKYADFTYGNIKTLTANLGKLDSKAQNILIGNSGDPQNRHDIIIDALKEISLSNRKVICPLSYGYDKYIEYILQYGYDNLKENFEPLTDFIPLNEYVNKISSCSVCIMNHHRQQGLGNIIVMLWLGAKVYLNEDSLAYSFFKNLNVKVFSIQKDLLMNSSLVFAPLTETEIESNRQILHSEYSEEKIFNETKILVNILTT
jgi:hypothetical protein